MHGSIHRQAKGYNSRDKGPDHRRSASILIYRLRKYTQKIRQSCAQAWLLSNPLEGRRYGKHQVKSIQPTQLHNYNLKSWIGPEICDLEIEYLYVPTSASPHQ